MKKQHSPKGTVPARILASGLRLVQVYRDAAPYTVRSDKHLYLTRFMFHGDINENNWFMDSYGLLRCEYNNTHQVTWDIFAELNSPLHKRTCFWEKKRLNPPTMTVAATPLLTGPLATLPARLGAGHGWERCLVVPLRRCGQDTEPMRLLPRRRLSTAILPVIGGPSLASKPCLNLGGSVIGKLVSEGHGQTLPRKNKSAMPKTILAIRRHCRHIAWVSQPPTSNENILTHRH